jgi:hypothetical protein
VKFIASGPDIPDKLLWERDAGQVVFVCGAGVSRAKANMPDFPTLASQVLDQLLVPEDGKARKILELALKTENDGLVPIDKVFGELERSYSIVDIEGAVSKALTAPPTADTECHEIIRDLATTPYGAIRLVTTNFDDLFSRVTDQPEWICPILPSFEHETTFSGLAYLHGKAGDQVNSTSGSFVLSTRSFGRAYMAEGWANDFIKKLLEHHTVVFVGYSADDPPMQYLLEALAQADAPQPNVYAFQQGKKLVADEKWRHRGVTPIAFDHYEDLWTTLELWRDRAVSQDDWIEARLSEAMVGPANLSDWERSQISHLASHRIGAKAIAERAEPIPPQWLFCFDSSFRYATPKKRYTPDTEIDHRDPFDVLGLIEDPTPKPISPDNPYSDRPTPSTVWDAFRITQQDITETTEERSFAFLRGPSATNASELSPRLSHLAVWIGKVANTPSAIRWAAYQTGLHPTVKRLIFWELEREKDHTNPTVEEAWEVLFETWDKAQDEHNLDLYRLKSQIERSGWSHTRVRQYRKLMAPRIELQSFKRAEAIFADVTKADKLSHLVEVSLDVPEDRVDIAVPDEWLTAVLKADRLNLDQAIDFKKQIGHYDFSGLPPIRPSDDPDISSYDRTYGINALAFGYLRRFEKLVNYDRAIAVAELRTWPLDDTNIFGRFRVWAAGNDQLMTNGEAGEMFASLPQKVFWGSRHQRDLLNSIKSRWGSLPLSTTRQIEERIVRGDDAWYGEETPKHTERRAWQSANMLQWLKDNGCVLNVNFEATIDKLKRASPTWSPEYAAKADDSLESRSGTVRTDTDHLILNDVSIDRIIDVAAENMGRGDNFLVEADPFRGLCMDHPTKALAALRRKAKLEEYPEWAWSRWLRRDGDDAWSNRTLALTTVLLCSASDVQIAELKYSVYRWFEQVSGRYPERDTAIRNQLFRRLMGCLMEMPDTGSSALVRRAHKEIEWVNETINSPAGQLAESLFNYPEIKDLGDGTHLPNAWLDDAIAMLDLGGDNRRFALVCFMQRLRWFFYWAPDWTNEHILDAVNSDDALTVDAYWSGLASGTRTIPSSSLFQKIKGELLNKLQMPFAAAESAMKNLSSLVLAGWLKRNDGERWVTDRELSGVLMAGSNDLRENILWQLWRWSSIDEEDPSFEWDTELEQFFADVWPRTLSAKSSGASERMLQIAFSNADRLPHLAPVILPRLAKLTRGSFLLLDLRGEDSTIVDSHPELVLDLLFAALSEDTNDWPYDMNKVLGALAKSSPKVAEDYRLVELLRRWASR